MPTTHSSPSDDRPWLKPSALAKREGVARQTIWNWAAKGLVEAKRLGRQTGVRVRVKASE